MLVGLERNEVGAVFVGSSMNDVIEVMSFEKR